MKVYIHMTTVYPIMDTNKNKKKPVEHEPWLGPVYRLFYRTL